MDRENKKKEPHLTTKFSYITILEKEIFNSWIMIFS